MFGEPCCRLSRNNLGLGVRSEKIRIDGKVGTCKRGQLDLVVLDPRGTRLAAHEYLAAPIWKRVDCIDNPCEIRWSKPLVVIGN